MSHKKDEVILLPYEHRFSRLYAEHIHRKGHLGVLYTSCKIGTKFWIVKLLKMVKSIRYNCVICKKLDKRLSEQITGKLPMQRLKPSPVWSCTAIDLFGQFKIWDEGKKRTIGKPYGVIFNCLSTLAVHHLNLAADYITLYSDNDCRERRAKEYSERLETVGTPRISRNGRIQVWIYSSWRALAKRDFPKHEWSQ